MGQELPWHALCARRVILRGYRTSIPRMPLTSPTFHEDHFMPLAEAQSSRAAHEVPSASFSAARTVAGRLRPRQEPRPTRSSDRRSANDKFGDGFGSWMDDEPTDCAALPANAWGAKSRRNTSFRALVALQNR